MLTTKIIRKDTKNLARTQRMKSKYEQRIKPSAGHIYDNINRSHMLLS